MAEDLRAELRTHWITRGDGQRPALFLHCSLASARSLVPVMEVLGRHLRMTAIDLPGHGMSADWDGQGDYVDRATDVAETFCEGRCDIVGHSLGAVVALSLMVRRPDLIRRAILIEPVLFAAAQGSAAFERYRADHAPIMEAIGRGEAAAATAAFTGIWGAGQSWAAIPQPARQAMIDRIHVISATAPALDEDATGILEDGGLEGVRAPVMLIRGGNSHPVIPEIFSTLSRRLPDARTETVPGAAHMAPITHPRDVARLIAEHVSRGEA